MDEWDDQAKKLLIQGVNIYDRCPSLDIVLIAILECYMDVAGNRNQDGVIAWDKIYLWCEYHGASSNKEFYLNVIQSVENKVRKWRRAGQT